MNPRLTYPQTQLARWSSRVRINLLVWSVALFAARASVTQAQDKFIAYVIPAGTVGNQNFSGTLGMEFDVANAIIITQLGVFDEGSDGLMLPITARLFDRATDPPTELATLEFSTDAPGTLIGGSRFKPLTTPLRLAAGFQGTIVAEGYGAEERLRNAGVSGGVVWTVDDGKGSIQFVGTSRYGTTPGEYPISPDSGPADRYAAGTFEFQTTPPELPGKPVVSLKPADKQVTISWAAVTQPAPAANYRVSRASDSAGPFSQIAEVTDTTYVDQALANGTSYCYTVKGVTADGKAGADSEPKCASPFPPLPANQQISYLVPVGVVGNQNFSGSLGMEFDVQNPIIVHKLGVFDDSSDGLKLPLTARIFNRDDETILAEIAFTPEDSGTPIEGMRFKPLTPPLRLETGFKGLIQADGYGAEERLRNAGVGGAGVSWTLNDGNGSILFVGGSRYGTSPGEYPPSPDSGPAARYAAGSFQYETTAPQKPGVPQLSVLLPSEDASATLQWNPVLNPLPAAKYQIFRATSVDGPFTQVAEVTTTTYHDTGLANGTEVFYSVRALGAGGETGPDSIVVGVTPNPRRAGAAYVNPANFDGNQAYTGSLGLDFNVGRPIQITKLGVWDEASDGLNLTLTAAVYDRQTRKPLVSLEFTTDSPGDLADGSRFKALPQPLVLAAGFEGTMVAYGYGDGERLFNRGIGPDDPTLFQTFDGGSLVFIGGSRYGAAGEFPASPDTGPAHRYAAGSFYFEPLADLPKVAVSISLSNGKVKISWSGTGALESALDITGPWAAVAGANSGLEITPTANRQFYRIKQ